MGLLVIYFTIVNGDSILYFKINNTMPTYKKILTLKELKGRIIKSSEYIKELKTRLIITKLSEEDKCKRNLKQEKALNHEI